MPFWQRRRRQHPESGARERLRTSVAAFLAADDWPASRRIVEQHLELLDPEADRFFQELAEAQPDPGERAAIEKHRGLLARCRVAGIAHAFAEWQAGDPAAGNRIAPEVLLALLHASSSGDQDEERRLLAEYPELNTGAEEQNELPADDAFAS